MTVERSSLATPTAPPEGWRPAGAVLVLHTTPRVVWASVVSDRGAVVHRHPEPVDTDATPDAAAIAVAVLRAAGAAVTATGGVRAIALATTPGILVAWDAEDGGAVATTARCRGPEAIGAWLDEFDPGRRRALLVGPLDAWVIWTLTEGARQATDVAAAAATGLLGADGSGWDAAALTTANLHAWALPQLASGAGPLAEAIPVTGCPPILANCSDRVAAVLGAGGGDPDCGVVFPAAGDHGPVVARWLGPADDAPATAPATVALVARSRRWSIGETDVAVAPARPATATMSSPVARTVVVRREDPATEDPASEDLASARPAVEALRLPGDIAEVDEADAVCWGAVSIVGVALGRWQDPAEGPIAPSAVPTR